MKKWILCLLILLIASSGMARPRDRKPEKWRGHEKPREMVDAFRLYRLTEELALNEEQTARIYPRYAEIARKSEEHREETGKAVKELKKLLEDGKTGKAADLAESIHASRAEFFLEQQGLRDEIFQLFDEEQKARFILFERKFQKHLKKVMDKRERGRRGRRAGKPGAERGPGRPGGPGVPHPGGW
ncbi:MAG: hypothetical protein QF492_00680 [Candidatus Krumholzibacteria bacterium]|nr:hypothetical protein [Candidatus Krumholzibacteria bacterium]MDP6668407.1 hypothetical protein [Candidatus Krumholzibacteria bacterium]MDP6797976.1 hypothetical protein [Candidatus Krumholzibacteria bacterium]MDP7021869.1 hypothetical protein [Candidatus Krumholzibacteria bacterium]